MASNFSIDDALFNIDSSSLFKDDKKTSAYDDLYRPSAKEGKDGVYKSVIRFIPFVKDPLQSIKSKWTVWLTNQNTDQSKMIDCPSSIKEKSILQDVFFMLKKSDNAREQDLAAQFTRRESFYSLVQIVKDHNHPELEGKIKIFKYGKKVHDKIKNIMSNDGMDGISDTNKPFDLFTGKLFMLHIKTVSNYNNYDDSLFIGEPKPIEIDGKPMGKTKENMVFIKKYLEDNSPDLNKYNFKPWDDEIKTFVLESIESILPSGKIKAKLFGDGSYSKEDNKISSVLSKAKSTIVKEKVVDRVEYEPSRDSLDDILEDDDIPQMKPSKKSKVTIPDDDDEDDLYKDL